MKNYFSSIEAMTAHKNTRAIHILMSEAIQNAN